MSSLYNQVGAGLKPARNAKRVVVFAIRLSLSFVVLFFPVSYFVLFFV
jgi:hypothetical protein